MIVWAVSVKIFVFNVFCNWNMLKSMKGILSFLTYLPCLDQVHSPTAQPYFYAIHIYASFSGNVMLMMRKTLESEQFNHNKLFSQNTHLKRQTILIPVHWTFAYLTDSSLSLEWLKNTYTVTRNFTCHQRMFFLTLFQSLAFARTLIHPLNIYHSLPSTF